MFRARRPLQRRRSPEASTCTRQPGRETGESVCKTGRASRYLSVATMRRRAGDEAERKCFGEGGEVFEVGPAAAAIAVFEPELDDDSDAEAGEVARALREMEEMNPARRRTESTPRWVREWATATCACRARKAFWIRAQRSCARGFVRSSSGEVVFPMTTPAASAIAAAFPTRLVEAAAAVARCRTDIFSML